MSEPFYIAQNGDCQTDDEGRVWIATRAEEAKAEGALLIRASVEPTLNLWLVEGWREKHVEDQGEPRWQLGYAPQPSK